MVAPSGFQTLCGAHQGWQTHLDRASWRVLWPDALPDAEPHERCHKVIPQMALVPTAIAIIIRRIADRTRGSFMTRSSIHRKLPG